MIPILSNGQLGIRVYIIAEKRMVYPGSIAFFKDYITFPDKVGEWFYTRNLKYSEVIIQYSINKQDKNGKELWVGDKIHFWEHHIDDIGIIQYSEKHTSFVVGKYSVAVGDLENIEKISDYIGK